MKHKIINIIVAILAFVVMDNGIGCVLKHGINNYFGISQHADVLLIGHSHLMLSVDKLQIEKELGVKISKYCREGVDVIDKYYMTKQILDSDYSDSLKVLMYGVDLFTFSPGGLSSNSYKLFYPFIDDKEIDRMIKEHTDAIDYWSHKLIKTFRYNDNTIINAAIRGIMNDWNNKKNGNIDIPAYKQMIDMHKERSISMDSTLIEYFKKTVKMATDRGILVILVNTPTLDLLNDYEPDKFAELGIWYKKFAANNELVEYWDFNPNYSNRHDLFYDRLHLNTKGQKIISKEITNRLSECGL